MLPSTDSSNNVGTPTREHYFFIDFLRAAACYLVIFHHCLGYFGDAPLAAFYSQYLKAFSPTVTLYLLISGFVHSGVIEGKSKPYRQYVWEKFNRIMIPYFFVSFVTIVLRLIVERTTLFPLGEVNYTPFIWQDAGLRLLLSGVEGHYYFLELLFAYLLIFPFLVKLLSTPFQALLFFLVVLALDPITATAVSHLSSPVWSPLGVFATALSGFKFFLFGFTMSRYYPKIKALVPSHGRAVVTTGLAFLFLFAVLHSALPQADDYWTFLQLFAYFLLALVFCNRRISLIVQISNLSFGIYLLHQPYFLKFSRLVLSPMHNTPNLQLIVTWMLTVVLTTTAIKLTATNHFVARWVLGKPLR